VLVASAFSLYAPLILLLFILLSQWQSNAIFFNLFLGRSVLITKIIDNLVSRWIRVEDVDCRCSSPWEVGVRSPPGWDILYSECTVKRHIGQLCHALRLERKWLKVSEVSVCPSKRFKAEKNRNNLFCNVPSEGTSDGTLSTPFGFTAREAELIMGAVVLLTLPPSPSEPS